MKKSDDGCKGESDMQTQTIKSKPGFLSRLGWVVMTFLALMLFLVASRYLTLNPDVFFPEQKLVYMAHITMIVMHVAGAMLAIIIGPFQFLEGMRSGRLLKVHRWLGRTYLIAVLVGGLAGLYMATFSYGGMVSHVGFASLAILWLFSGFMAYKHIRNKNLDLHRDWMTRNYALTFAGVMLRLWMPTFVMAGVDFTAGYVVIAWLCWVPNLIVAQWIINRRRNRESDLVESKSAQVLNRNQETS
jgi:uncharacterized membrane protein